MIRARKSLDDYRNFYNNNININEDNVNDHDRMLHKHYTQSQDESTTSGSVTASTASLSGHQQRQSLSLAPAAVGTSRTLVGLNEQQHNQLTPGYLNNNYKNNNNNNYYHHLPHPAAHTSTQKRNYATKVRKQYPGRVVAHHNHAVLQVTPRNNHNGLLQQQQYADNNGQEGKRKVSAIIRNSIRRIRRPQLWLPKSTTKAKDAIDLEKKQQQKQDAAIQKASVIEKGKAFFIEFLQGSSIHGFIYLAKFGLHFVERTLWFSFICVALFSIISLSRRTWERFQTSPMVISMDRNKLVWNTSFPSLTVCPHKRIDELKVDEYILKHKDDFEDEEDKDHFRDFIVKLASLSYDNIETLPVNKTYGIPSEKYLDLLYELKWNFEPELSSGAAVKMFIYETLTEFGICHSVNSLVARYNSYYYWKNNDWNLLDHGDRVTVHPLDGEIYAQIINLSTAYDVYFHGAGDIPNISKQRYTFSESDYTTVELIALEIYTAEEARAFTTKQRKCRFQYEADDMLTVPIYSFGLCLAECRMFFALKVCGCVPHFYRNRLKTGRILPVCGFEGLMCLADIKSEIISLKSNRFKIDCNCLSNCDDSNFFVQSYRSRVWFLGANLQWGIIDYPKMQLRRDVLFSFADVLVYIGGLVGFFLGCSALSFTEIIYFFTARLVKRMFGKTKINEDM